MKIFSDFYSFLNKKIIIYFILSGKIILFLGTCKFFNWPLSLKLFYIMSRLYDEVLSYFVGFKQGFKTT